MNYNFDKKVIMATVDEETFSKALTSECDLVFMLSSDVLTVGEKIATAHKAGKKVFVHIDMADGIGKDKLGVEYLRARRADGIITTKNNLALASKKAGMADFESLQGRFKYYIADNEIGFIEMESTYATQIAQCLSGDERFDHFTYTLFKETYVFTDLVNIPFSYIMMPDGLRLAIGDRTGIFNLSALLYHWEEITGSAKYMNGATPFSSLYGNWGQKENYSDQIWLNLNEK